MNGRIIIIIIIIIMLFRHNRKLILKDKRKSDLQPFPTIDPSPTNFIKPDRKERSRKGLREKLCLKILLSLGPVLKFDNEQVRPSLFAV